MKTNFNISLYNIPFNKIADDEKTLFKSYSYIMNYILNFKLPPYKEEWRTQPPNTRSDNDKMNFYVLLTRYHIDTDCKWSTV